MFDNGLVALLFFSLLWLARHKRQGPFSGWLVRFGLNAMTLLLSSVSLPLGPEDGVVRRRPFVTYSIAGMCLAVFLLQVLGAPGSGRDAELARARRDASAYSLERPYLRVPPLVLAYWDRDALTHESVQRVRWGGPDRTAAAIEQIELDRRSDHLDEVLRRRPQYRWANVPASSTWLTKLRAAFVHEDWFHILGNLLFLVAFAPYVEDVYGRPLFAILYLSSAIAGGVAANATAASLTFHYGASGAISGVMGAYLVRFARRRLVLLGIPSLWLPVLRVRVSIPAYGFLLLWLAENIADAQAGIPGIGWAAHLGGFANGVLFALLLRVTRAEEYLVNPGIEGPGSLDPHPAVSKSFALRTKGRFESALRAVEAALVEQPRDLGLLRDAYDASVAAGRLDRAGTHATRVLGVLAARRTPDELRETLLFIREVRTTLGVSIPARFYFAAGDCLERQGQNANAMRLYEGLVESVDKPVATRSAARRARLLKRLGRASGPGRAGVGPHARGESQVAGVLARLGFASRRDRSVHVEYSFE